MVAEKSDHDASEDGFESNLIDVSDIPVGALLDADTSVFANAIRRFLVDDPGELDVVAGFGENI